MTLQNAPPGLDYDRDRIFSKVMMILSGDHQKMNISLVVNYPRLFSGVYLSKYFQL
jgi:hypothetical protein